MSRDSKFLSRVLRHEPELIDLQIDAQGWVWIDELLRRLKKAGRGLSRDRLLEIVETNDKQRFTISPDGRRLRAAQGHSIDVDLGLIARQATRDALSWDSRPESRRDFRERPYSCSSAPSSSLSRS